MKKILLTLIIMLILTIILVPIKTFASNDFLGGANNFIHPEGGTNVPINQNTFVQLSDAIYGIVVGIGSVAAVVVGTYLGLKFIVSTVDEKADIKKTLVAYVIGCIVVFGAVIIWRIAINILSKV